MLLVRSRRAVVSGLAQFVGGVFWRKSEARLLAIPSAMAAQQSPPLRRCNFSGTATTVSEAALRDAVRRAAAAEREHWLAAGGAGVVSGDAQFGDLVRYWLARQ